jgi:hypothetical protein
MNIPVNKLTESAWRACFWAGLILIVLAACGRLLVIADAKVVNPEFLIPIFVLGTILLLVTAFVALTEARGTTPTGAPSPAIAKKDYVATVDSPTNKTVPIPVLIAGTLKRTLPDGFQLWLVNHGTENGHAAFWPQTEAKVVGKRWSVTYEPREFEHLSTRRLQMYLVGKEAQKLLSYFKQANSFHTAKTGEDGPAFSLRAALPIWSPYLLILS